MSDFEGIEHVIRAAQEAVHLQPIGWEDDRFYAAVNRDSGGETEIAVIDLDAYRATAVTAEHPVRKSGTVTVRDAASFIGYVRKHGDEHTEVWADLSDRTVTAVLNAHHEGDGPAGWGDHRVQLRLAMSPAWNRWTGSNGEFMAQEEFAELVEERSVDFRGGDGGQFYSAADMLELAQTFKATSGSTFEASHRVKSGETQLVYTEETTATAGRRGDLAIPDQFRLVVQPFLGGTPYAVYCRLRYRIDRNSKRLYLGFLMERPHDVLEEAFKGYVDEIRGVRPDGTVDLIGIEQDVWWGQPS